MRRVGVVLLLAVSLAGAGCTARSTTVPGAAAPLTATASPSGSTDVPMTFQDLTMDGFGVSVSLPVPDGWARKPSSSAGLIRTDVDLENPEVLLRVDLSARGPGTAEDLAERNESATKLTDYKRIAIKPVSDSAVDWSFTFERDGTRQVIDRQIVQGTASIAVYYSAPTALYDRYLPVWQRAVRDLKITTN